MKSLPDQLTEIARRLRRSLRMDRTGEMFLLEQDEAIHDLEVVARHAEGHAVEVRQ